MDRDGEGDENQRLHEHAADKAYAHDQDHDHNGRQWQPVHPLRQREQRPGYRHGMAEDGRVGDAQEHHGRYPRLFHERQPRPSRSASFTPELTPKLLFHIETASPFMSQ